jgi:sugar (pentulose or hexulose) kinase
MSWDELSFAAEMALPFQSFIDPKDPGFLLSQDMPETIRSYCRRTGQKIPESMGAVVRCIYESLALKFRYTYDSLISLLGWKPESLNIVGGGGKDPLLSQLTANAIGLPVICGPYEATVIGNILMQMIAKGEIKNRDEGKEIIRRSCVLKSYGPADQGLWEEKYFEYTKIIRRSKTAGII